MNIHFRVAVMALMCSIVPCAVAQTKSPASWRDRMIYFVVTDRFANGDTSNDDFGKGEYDPKDIDFYHGGDFAGLTAKLDYIQGLGAGAVWITPPVANQWVSPLYGKSRYGGYHGYWAQNLYDVDAHLGGMEAYKAFVREAHARDMAVIQDIVCNHLGDFTSTNGKVTSQGGYPEHPAPPFEDQSAEGGLFHYSGKDIWSREFANLDDLNTDNPAVVGALIGAFKFWIRETDIDGFRVDTAVYVPMSFWKAFVPEIMAYAKSLGKDNFLIFAEDYEFDMVANQKFDEACARQASYTGTSAEPIFNSMLDFAFCGAATSIFAGSRINGRPWGKDPRYGSFALLDKLFSPEIAGQYADVARDQLVTFIDNHDMTRMNSENKSAGDLRAVRLAVGAMLTLPGIPCLYYGTEQGFSEPPAKKGEGIGGDNRQDMWVSGYDANAPLYAFVAKLNALRKAYPALARGSYQGRIVDGEDAAIYSYSRILDGEEVFVIINRSNGIQWAKPMPDMAGTFVDALEPGTKTKKGAFMKVKMMPQSIRIFVPLSEWNAANPRK